MKSVIISILAFGVFTLHPIVSQNGFQPITTDDEFNSNVLNSLVPVVVKFSASWCSDCCAMEPVDKQIAFYFRPKPYMMATNKTPSPELVAFNGARTVPLQKPMRMGPGPVMNVQVKFYVVDVDRLKNRAQAFAIKNYPTYVFMKKGKEQFRVIEKPMTFEEFKQKIEQLIRN